MANGVGREACAERFFVDIGFVFGMAGAEVSHTCLSVTCV